MTRRKSGGRRRPSLPGFLRRPRRLTVIVVVAVLILASAGGIWAATGSSAASYRWSTAKKADVDQTLDSYGTVKPINQAAVAFPVSGTIATVPVTVGEHVTTGQTLATIEVSSLQAQLDSARSALATAQAKLVTDTQAQADERRGEHRFRNSSTRAGRRRAGGAVVGERIRWSRRSLGWYDRSAGRRFRRAVKAARGSADRRQSARRRRHRPQYGHRHVRLADQPAAEPHARHPRRRHPARPRLHRPAAPPRPSRIRARARRCSTRCWPISSR